METQETGSRNESIGWVRKLKSNKTPLLVAGLMILTAVLVVLAVPARQNVNQQGNKERTAKEEPKATLSISTPKSLGERQYEADIIIDSNGYTVSGADLALKYDHKYISTLKITNGTFLTSASSLKNEINLKSGTATYSAITDIGTAGAKGKGVLAVVTFTVAGSPPSAISISFDPGTNVAAEGHTNSVLGEAFGLSFVPETK